MLTEGHSLSCLGLVWYFCSVTGSSKDGLHTSVTCLCTLVIVLYIVCTRDGRAGGGFSPPHCGSLYGQDSVQARGFENEMKRRQQTTLLAWLLTRQNHTCSPNTLDEGDSNNEQWQGQTTTESANGDQVPFQSSPK